MSAFRRTREGDRLGAELSTAVVLFHEAVGRQVGLSAADQRALSLIRREGPFTAGALAQRTGVTSGAATGLIDRLERGGHVRRAADPADRRRTLVAARPDAPGSGALEELGRAMGAFMARYDETQLAVIEDYVRGTIEILTDQTRRLAP
ncbi:MarR family transcriptional regulator [Streptomyces spiroverticillatus]|uniref:MarR family transcriptional regulator n=1 Tax=Streptomyces finlayi TaxID=67296 RepID=A0A919C9D7_9ACTN|nr:MarR family transcriptional regulator [Streptomyces finlayi]GHA06605.1 MarR family transcriptional regulator [Streptomyces spiroverticillatus]GHC90118.1 MarR family transcriptional regulator [Streptomyces finlayi]